MSNRLHVRSPVDLSFKDRLRAGFTLLELSIVLVVIGLLIGGVFAGQSLIHNAQLNAFISESNRYQTAIQAFREQYLAMPGDMKTATVVWGSAGGTGSDAACMAIASGTSATCNGNGDGYVLTSTAVGCDECARLWQHLANAKVIEGSYTGVIGGTSWLPGVNEPMSKYGSTTGWIVASSTNLPSAGDVNWFAADYGSGNNLATYAAGSTIAVKDAWSIDKKVDDGRPAQGNVLGNYWSTCTTASANTDSTATYKLSTPSAVCNLVFLTSF